MEENTQIEIFDVENIKNLIYCVRGKQVMLDSDVAIVYHSETKHINRVVKRNIERFPEEFCFQITEEEFQGMRCQFGTALNKENDKHRNKRYLPYVFTEQGIAMISALLRSEVAIKTSINIMKAFIEMRKFIYMNGQVFERLTSVEYGLIETNKRIDVVFDELQKDKKEQFTQKLFFEGQIYDAYDLIIKIIKRAKNKILIIDNYIDDSILEMLTKKNEKVEVIILTSSRSNISGLDVQKFNEEYPTLKIARTKSFHDRFIVIDNKELYHCGASLKDLGKKCFGINKIEDKEYINKISKVV